MYLRFRPRAGVYRNSTGNLTFDPKTGEGRSYDWYQITARIEGLLVLNSYRYSNTTQRHVRELRSLLESLELPFVEIEAPAGLQDLGRARAYELDRYADGLVAEEFARIKTGAPSKARFVLLERLGAMPATDWTFKQAESMARARRDDRLARESVARTKRRLDRKYKSGLRLVTA